MPNSFNHTLSNLVRHMYRMVVYVGLGLITTSCLKLFDNYFLFSIIYISRIFAYTCIIGIVGLEYKIFFCPFLGPVRPSKVWAKRACSIKVVR